MGGTSLLLHYGGSLFVMMNLRELYLPQTLIFSIFYYFTHIFSQRLRFCSRMLSLNSFHGKNISSNRLMPSQLMVYDCFL